MPRPRSAVAPVASRGGDRSRARSVSREPFAGRVHEAQGRSRGIFWQSSRTTKQARPGVRIPGRRALAASRFHDHRRYAASATPTSSPVSRSRSNGTRCASAITASTSTASSSPLSSASRWRISFMGSIDGSIQYQLADLASLERSRLSSKTDIRRCSRSNAPIQVGSPICWLASRCDTQWCRSCSVETRRACRGMDVSLPRCRARRALDNPLS